MALHSVELGHRRTTPPNSIEQEVADSSHRLFHQVDRSQASVLYHRAGHEELRVKEYHYKIWDPTNSNLGQWDSIRLQLLQELLLGARHPKCLLHPGIPTEQRLG